MRRPKALLPFDEESLRSAIPPDLHYILAEDWKPDRTTEESISELHRTIAEGRRMRAEEEALLGRLEEMRSEKRSMEQHLTNRLHAHRMRQEADFGRQVREFGFDAVLIDEMAKVGITADQIRSLVEKRKSQIGGNQSGGLQSAGHDPLPVNRGR